MLNGESDALLARKVDLDEGGEVRDDKGGGAVGEEEADGAGEAAVSGGSCVGAGREGGGSNRGSVDGMGAVVVSLFESVVWLGVVRFRLSGSRCCPWGSS